MLGRTAPFRAELERCFPERPFDVEFWDGSELPATDRNGGPRFRVSSPGALAHALRAPGQLGIGRAYVSGLLEVDDVDAALLLLDSWRPPPLAVPGARAARPHGRTGDGPHAPAAHPAGRAAPARPAPQPRARRARGPPPLRREQRVLRALPRRLADLQLRDLLARGADARGRAGAEARSRLHQARPRARAARARRGLRLGQLRAARRLALRRGRGGHHAVRAAGGAGPPARGGGGAGRPDRHPRDGLPRPRRRALRRDRQHRHGRARGRGRTSTSMRASSPACSCPAAGC